MTGTQTNGHAAQATAHATPRPSSRRSLQDIEREFVLAAANSYLDPRTPLQRKLRLCVALATNAIASRLLVSAIKLLQKDTP